jgi:S-adenosylmethionine hydrolase
MLTDFGTQDEYVGVLKGVILTINPLVTIIDITHHIAPQEINQAGAILDAAFSWFPEGTIHLAIVDPGVGSERDIIALHARGHTFIAPNNGLLTTLLGDGQPNAVVRVENKRLFRQPVSATFHGRDIFAPVAAHLSLGMPLETLGPTLGADRICKCACARCEFTTNGDIIGQVIYVDRFGNLGTNIDTQSLEKLAGSSRETVIRTEICGHRIQGLAQNYSQSGPGQLVALFNSRNRLEIAVNGGNAAQMVAARPGTVVRIAAKKNLKDPGL